jgi:hypothetical protein
MLMRSIPFPENENQTATICCFYRLRQNTGQPTEQPVKLDVYRRVDGGKIDLF